jgi:curved DNA-binding protein CbpA
MANINSDDYYKVLGISRDADENVIKKAYRKLAMKYHPDKNKEEDAEKNFKKVGEAYGVLSDKDQKQQYDQFGKSGIQGGHQMNPNDIFQSFFGGNSQFRNTGRSHSSHSETIFMQSSHMNGIPGMNMNGMPGMFHNNTFNEQVFGNSRNRNSNRTRRFILQNGTKMITRDLCTSDKNNLIGRIDDYDKHADRYIISFKNNNLLSLKKKNIMVIVKVRHIESDCLGKIVGYKNQQYNLLLNINNKSIKVEDVSIHKFIVSNGNLVEIRNIQSKPELNNKYGIIKNYDARVKRYTINLEDNTLIKVKLNNIFI